MSIYSDIITNVLSIDGRNVGSAKLELAYNDLNPQQPVLIVKLLDILFQSSKNLSSGMYRETIADNLIIIMKAQKEGMIACPL